MQTAIQGTLYRSVRTSERMPLGRSSTLRTSDGAPIDIIIEDLSMSGCRIRAPLHVGPEEELAIGLPGVGRRRCRVAWSNGLESGCEFEAPLTAAEIYNTRVTETLVQGQFSTLPLSPTAAQAATHGSRLSARHSLIAIIAAALAAWLGIAAALTCAYLLFA